MSQPEDLMCELKFAGDDAPDAIAGAIASIIDGRAEGTKLENAVLLGEARAGAVSIAIKPGVLRVRYVHTLALVLERLWARGFAVRAECAFAEELPRFGG